MRQKIDIFFYFTGDSLAVIDVGDLESINETSMISSENNCNMYDDGQENPRSLKNQKSVKNRRWSKRTKDMDKQAFIPKNNIGNSFDFDNPLDAFLLFLDDEFMNKLLYETNLKSVQEGKPCSVTLEELYAFLGINIVMGYHPLPSLMLYWHSGEDLGIKSIQECMSRDRFKTILRYLHVNDNSKIDKDDKLYKIRPMIQSMNNKFLASNNPKENLSIDESMIKFKGRTSLKQYNPMKPIKRGYKLWCIADMDGYIYNFEVYTGKNKSNLQTKSDLGLGGDVVMRMIKSFEGRNHRIYFDNFFSSVELLEVLKGKGIQAAATIRSNRKGLPQFCDDKQLQRGNFDFQATNALSVYKWMDSKAVHLISNFHGSEVTSVTRKNAQGHQITVSCPEVVKDYNSYMGGVDKHDQLRKYYGRDRRSNKWWHRLFFGLLDMAMINAFILFNETQYKKIVLLDFCREVGLGLMSKNISRKPCYRRKQKYSVPDTVRMTNTGIHWPVFLKEKGRCQVCRKNGIESRPSSQCSHCKVFLCSNSAKDCFIKFHNE